MAEYGTVTGRVLIPSGDSADIGDIPDEVPAVGTVSFIPRITHFVDTVDNLIVPAAKVTGVLDAEGRLSNPKDMSQKYIKLIATNSANINPQNWTYEVIFDLAPGQGFLPNFDTNVLAGQTVDLSDLIGVPGSTGNTISELTAAVAAAVAAAEAAAASAAAAAALIASPQSLANTPIYWRTLDGTGLAYAGRPVTTRPVVWKAVRENNDPNGNWVPIPSVPGTTSSGTGMVIGLDEAETPEDVEVS